MDSSKARIARDALRGDGGACTRELHALTSGPTVRQRRLFDFQMHCRELLRSPLESPQLVLKQGAEASIRLLLGC